MPKTKSTSVDRIAATAVPSITLLMKLGSIVVHADEATELGGHSFDIGAMRTLIDDPEVKKWIEDMGVLLPRKRSAR